jgi:hypothetical protein
MELSPHQKPFDPNPLSSCLHMLFLRDAASEVTIEVLLFHLIKKIQPRRYVRAVTSSGCRGHLFDARYPGAAPTGITITLTTLITR